VKFKVGRLLKERVENLTQPTRDGSPSA
jgi:hypothetical protein